MRKMKDSGIEWIGEIPQEWEVLPAKIVFSENKQKNIDGLEQNALKFYNGTIIQKSNFDAEDDDYVAETIRNYTVVRPNMIMINGLNLNYDLKSLRVAIVTQNGIITSAYLSLIPDESRIVPKFAVYLFKGYETKMAFHNMGAGIRKTLGYKEFKYQPVLVPSLPEQERIAEFLDKRCAEIDKVIADTQKTIEEYKALKQSVITEAVTKGIRKNRPMKDSGIEWIGEIPQEWEVGKLKHHFTNGKGLPITKENLILEGLPVISYGQIHSKSNTGVDINSQLLRYVDFIYATEYPQCEVFQNDFVFADTSEDYEGCGNCVYKRDTSKLFAGYHAIILHSIQSSDKRYFAYLFQSDCWRKQLRETVYGVKVFSITQKMLLNATLLLPTEGEQKEISDYLDSKCKIIDSIISNKEAQIEPLESYKKSVIYEYVTGKKEVHND